MSESPSHPRGSTAVAVLVAVGLMVVCLAAGQPARAGAAEVGLRFPAPAGTEWEVIGGYNTVTHEGVDPYALDLSRTDRSKTGGTPLLAPISGRMGYISDTCVSVRNDEINVLMCHVFADPGLERGQQVQVGDRLGTVAPDGEAENNGIAHIHLQVNVAGSRGSGGDPVPLTGAHALEGVSLPPTATYNAYYLRRFVSTNDPVLALPRVEAGTDRRVGAGTEVTLTASAENASQFTWQQVEGPAVALQPAGAAVTFHSPEESGAVLRFQVTASGPRGIAVDSVRVSVGGTVPVSGDTRGRLLDGAIPDQGVGLILFGGGTNEELLAASGCAAEAARFFATVDGRFIGYIPGAQVAVVNADWDAHFPDGLPAHLALLARCG